MSGPEDEEDDDVITFTDDDGNPVSFEFLGEVEVDGMTFALLTPAGIEDEAEIDIHIFKMEPGDEPDETLFSDDIEPELFERVQAAAEALFAGDDEDEE